MELSDYYNTLGLITIGDTEESVNKLLDALRDISKKHAELVWQEVERWDLSNPRISFTYKLAAKLLK